MSRLLSLLTIDAPIGALATYFETSGADTVGALLNVMRMRLRAVADTCLYHQLLSLLLLSKSPLAPSWHQRLMEGGLETICRHQIERNEMEGVNASLLIASLHSRHLINTKTLDTTMFSQVGDVAAKLSPQPVHRDDFEEDEMTEEQEEVVSISTASTNRSMSDGGRYHDAELWRLNPMERMSGFWRISLVPSTHADFEKIDLGMFGLSFEETSGDADSQDEAGNYFDILQNPTLRVHGSGLLSSQSQSPPFKLSSKVDGYFDAASLKLTFNITSETDDLFCSAIAFPLGFGGYFGRFNSEKGDSRSIKILGCFLMWRDLLPFSSSASKELMRSEIYKVRQRYSFTGNDYCAGKSEDANTIDVLPSSTPTPFFSVVQRRPHMWLMVNTYSMLVWKLSLWESADYATLHSMDGADLTAPAFRISSMATMLKQRAEFESSDIYALRLKTFEAASSSLYYARLSLTLSYTVAEVMADLAVIQHAMRIVYRHPQCSPEFLKDSAAFSDMDNISPGKKLSVGGDSERAQEFFDSLMERVERTSNAFSNDQYRFRQACAKILTLTFDPNTYGEETEKDKPIYAAKVKEVWAKWRRRWSQIHPALFSTSAPSLLDRPCSLDEVQLMLSHAAYMSSLKGETLYFDDYSDSSSSDDEDKPIIKPRSNPSSMSTASTSTSPSDSRSDDSSFSSSPSGSSPLSSPEGSTNRIHRPSPMETRRSSSPTLNGADKPAVHTSVPLATTTALVVGATLSLGAYFVGRWLLRSKSD